MVNERTITKAFESLGSRVRFDGLPSWRSGDAFPGLELDIRRDGKGEFYVIRRNPAADDDLSVLDVRPSRRHLVLLFKRHTNVEGAKPRLRFLCGHDEREWFVAALPAQPRVTTVDQAMEALKPEVVRESQRSRGVRRKDLNRRRNAGFIRQGEWFFVPAPDFAPDGFPVHHHEPLRRGRGKPHVAEELVRYGGERVRFNDQYPNGLNEEEFRALIARRPRAARSPWRTGVRRMTVYVRGGVRHPDHGTVVLVGWHRVVPSTERVAPGRVSVTFVD